MLRTLSHEIMLSLAFMKVSSRQSCLFDAILSIGNPGRLRNYLCTTEKNLVDAFSKLAEVLRIFLRGLRFQDLGLFLNLMKESDKTLAIIRSFFLGGSLASPNPIGMRALQTSITSNLRRHICR